MTAMQRGLTWGMGILLWINLLSVLLSAWEFGSVDWTTVAHMGMIAFPPLAVGAVFLYRFRPLVGRREIRGDLSLSSRTQAPVRAGR